jgi:hypothetical protein
MFLSNLVLCISSFNQQHCQLSINFASLCVILSCLVSFNYSTITLSLGPLILWSSILFIIISFDRPFQLQIISISFLFNVIFFNQPLVIRCKQDNINHTYLLLGLLLGEFFKNNKKKSSRNFLKYYYVKVYVKHFKIYMIFRSFEVYL